MDKQIIEIIDREIKLLLHARKVLVSLGSRITRNGGNKPQRKMSAAGRERIAAAQRKRWRKIRAAKKK
jgi:hypothetical protein